MSKNHDYRSAQNIKPLRYKSEFMRNMVSGGPSEQQAAIKTISDGLELESLDIRYITDVVKKIQREKRFIAKVQRMVNDVECGDNSFENQKYGGNEKPFAKEVPSIAECWRWLKGLLYDFIN